MLTVRPNSADPSFHAPQPSLEGLQRLEELNAAASKIIYMALQPTEMRIVKIRPGGIGDAIHCTVSPVSMSSESDIQYEALSYLWGSHANPRDIILNGQVYKVTRNLFKALVHMRLPTQERIMWIDALAINQSDVAERNHQVQRMAEIFSGARQVRIWLGTGDKGIRTVMRTLQSGDEDPSNLDMEFATALERLVLNPYWLRVWIVQEIMHATSAVVQVGPFTVEYGACAQFITRSFAILGTKFSKSDTDWERRCGAMSDMGPNRIPGPGSAAGLQYISASDWADKFVCFAATDPRDRVFGLHGCFEPNFRSGIQIDYSADTSTVLASFARALIENHGAVLIGDARGPVDFPQSGHDLPSWVSLDVSDTEDGIRGTEHRTTFCGKSEPYVAACRGYHDSKLQFSEDNKILSMRGVDIGAIRLVLETFWPAGDSWDGTDYSTAAIEAIIEHCVRAFRMMDMPPTADGPRRFLASLSSMESRRQTLSLLKQLPAALFDRETDPSFIATELAEDPETRECFWRLQEEHKRRAMLSFEPVPGGEHVPGFTGWAIGVDRMKAGDKICVLFGVHAPVILRPAGGHYFCLGDAFVPGFMSGEAIQTLLDGAASLVEYEIH